MIKSSDQTQIIHHVSCQALLLRRTLLSSRVQRGISARQILREIPRDARDDSSVQNNKLRVFFSIFFLGLILAQNIFATDSNVSHLKQIKNQIQNLQINLKQDDAKKNQVQKDLQQNEIRMSQLTTQLQQSQKSLAAQEQELKSLMHQQSLSQRTLEQQQIELSQQLRIAYQLGQQDYLKVFFNQKNTSQMSRMWMYYHYLIQNRMNTIHAINSTLTELVQNQEKIKDHSNTLLKLQTQLQQYNNQLQIVKQDRAQVLTQLNSEMQSKQEKLETLMANKAALEKVLNQIETRETVYSRSVTVAFTKHDGKFSWPTAGQIIQNYGAAIEQSELKSNGVLIDAPEGQAVHAIASGRVVFANWMSGYGFLIIIDHGQGLMSIYGQNATLYKKEGNTVRAGEIIANVGNTGGYSQPGLYFAIRHQGKPVDPSLWCA